MELSNRYNARNLRRVAEDPSLLRYELRRIGLELNTRYHRLRDDRPWCRVADEDWDDLLVLDACRYDMFEARNGIDGRLERRVSAGSESWEFLSRNFADRTLHDTVYLTANPHAVKLPPGTFHDTINLLDTAWDADLKTVRPGAVVEAAVEAHDRYPNKRLVVHFMQPHFPFIGDLGREISHRGISTDDGDSRQEHVWTGLARGTLDVDPELVVDAYRENLDVALPHVERLIEALPGRTVVTSDHGNLIGERLSPVPVRWYGHPRGLRVPALTDVPWHVVDGERRTVTAEPPVERERRDPSDEVVERRLADLGYA